jgi:hypothetical protein
VKAKLCRILVKVAMVYFLDAQGQSFCSLMAARVVVVDLQE